MEKFTEKEKGCLFEYTDELKHLIEEDNLATVSDNRCSYTWQEVDVLSKKIKKIND